MSQMTKTAAEDVIRSTGLAPVKVAEIAGALVACKEAELDAKQAAEYLGIPETALHAVHRVALEE